MNTMKFLEPLHNVKQLANLSDDWCSIEHTADRIVFTFQVANSDGVEQLQDIVLKNSPSKNSIVPYTTKPYIYGQNDWEE